MQIMGKEEKIKGKKKTKKKEISEKKPVINETYED